MVSRQTQKPGFTLVELLTVVAIIALLIGILLPSLSQARSQAKKVKTAATISAVEKSLEMFHNDFGQYPDSARRPEPIADYAPGGGEDNMLNGAHWLARALLGHDMRGVDAMGLSMKSYNDFPEGQQPTLESLNQVGRKGLYFESADYAADTDAGVFGLAGSPATGRPVLFDSFEGPILYYRAGQYAQELMSYTNGASALYNMDDNKGLTGCGCSSDLHGWDFARLGDPNDNYPIHPLGQFSVNDFDPDGASDLHELHEPPVNRPGKTFVDYFHDHKAHEIAETYKPVRANSFVLISAGKDGLLGTDDDVNNFDR